MKTTSVFDKNIKAYSLYSGSDTIIANQGGQGSSKTMSILQLLFIISQRSESGKRITIGSYALPHLKAGAMSDFDKILMDSNVNPSSVCNLSESKYYINKSVIEFVGIEGNEARVTGPRRDILYINEANKRIKYEVFDLANSRTSDCTFIDFNPSREFWFHEKIIPSLKHCLIKSNFYDNEYLPERERFNILSKKDKPGFENWWKVYGLGELGQLEDAIFSNWKFGAFNENLPFGYGLDFGSKDPDAMTKVAIDRANKKIYIKEIIYETGLATHQLSALIKTRTLPGKLIVADSAAKRTIDDLRFQKLNIEAVSKGRIVEDIKMILDYEIIIDETSTNLAKELNNWIWLDKKGEIPLDDYNHLIDSFRYYCHKILTSKPHQKMRAI